MKTIIGICMVLFGYALAFGGNVKEFGAVGDGQTDDTRFIRQAIDRSTDGVLFFPKGIYVVSSSIRLDLAKTKILSIYGEGGARIKMIGKGPALHVLGDHLGSAHPETIRESTWKNTRMPMIYDLEIVGENPASVGLEISNTLQCIVRNVLIRKVKYGIHLTHRNRNVIIQGSQIYQCHEIGIFLDQVNIHQMNIDHSHISYNARSGIKVLGGEIRNFQINGNDIEYNYDESGQRSADIWLDTRPEGSSIREGTIVGNTIQAMPSPDGANILMQGNPDRSTKIGLWSITGNHISNQSTNLALSSCQGISITGNTFIRGYDIHVKIKDSKNIVFSNNVLDRNPDYFPSTLQSKGGIILENVSHILCNGLIAEGPLEQPLFSIIHGSQIQLNQIQGTHLQYSAIELRGSQGIQVSNSLFTQAGDQGKFDHFIRLFDTNTGIQVVGNMFYGQQKVSICNADEDSKENQISNNLILPLNK